MDQIHLMLLKVSIHKIHLSVRFPCSLTFQLKVDNKVIDCKGTYELVKGLCNPQETLRLQIQLQKKEGDTYREKQAKIVIFMTSANGKIPAGSATIDLHTIKTGFSEDKTMPVQKCPDKTANISFTYTLDFLRNLPKIGSHSKANSLYSRLEQSLISSGSRIRKTGGQTKSPGQKIRFNTERKGMYQSAATYQILNRNVPEHDYDQNRGSRASGSGYGDDDDLLRKVVHLQKQKTQHMKQLSKLKKQLSRKHLDDRGQADQHYNRLKDQLNIVVAQNEGLRQKVRNNERKQKQLSITVKQLKEQLQRKKEKTYQQEFIRLQSQSILDDKQKIIKQMQLQLKQCEQQISDYKINLSTQQKRIEFKEVSLKDQLTKLNQKYQQSEIQRQKAIVQLNTMLQQLESSEKKHQLVLKQKDKTQAEQKNKLLKKNQAITRELQQLKDQMQQRSTQISDLQREIKLLQSKLNQSLSQTSNIRLESRNTSHQLEKQREVIRNLQKEIQRYQQIAKQATQQKKKYLELQQQYQKQKKNVEGCQKTIQQLTIKGKQTQQALVGKNQEISALMTKIYNLNSQVQQYKRQEQNFNKQAQNLSVNNLHAANKIEQLRGKLDQLQLSYNELQLQSQQQISYMIKTKQYLQSDLQQTKWNLQKYKDNYEEQLNKNKLLSNQILEVSRKVLQLEEKNNKLQETLSQAKTSLAIITQERQMQTLKEKDLQEKLKEKNEQIYQFNKKITKADRQNYNLSQKCKHLQKFYTDKLQSQEGISKNKQSKLNQSIQTINSLQIQLIAKEEQITSLRSTNYKLNTENQYSKQQIKSLKKENSDLSQKISQLNQENLSLIQRLNLTIHELDGEKNIKTATVQKLNKRINQLQDQKNKISFAFQNFMNQIAKQPNPNTTMNESLLCIMDEKLSTLQIQTLKKRNNSISKYESSLRKQEGQLKVMQEQIQKMRRAHLDKEQQLQRVIQKQKQKAKSFHSDISAQKQQLMEKISMLEDKVFQLAKQSQKLHIENQQFKLNCQEQQSIIHQLNFQMETIKAENKSSQNNIKVLKQQIIKTKANYQNNFLTSASENTAQIDKLRKVIAQNDKKMQNLQKSILQKQQTISKLDNNLQNITHQRQKSQQKAQQLTNKLNQITQERKLWIQNQKGYQKQIKRLQQVISNIQSQIEKKNKRVDELEIEKKKIQEAYSQQQQFKNKVIGELQIALQNNRSLQQLLKETGDKTKKTSEKSTLQIKKLKQQIISLNGTIQIKLFEINQHQSLIKSLKSANQQVSQELLYKKQQIIAWQLKLQQVKNNNILLTQQVQSALSDKSTLEEEVRTMKQTIINLQQILNENQSNLETLVLKQRQITRLKQEINSKQRNYQKLIQDLRNQTNQLKKQVSNRTQRQQEYKKKVRDLQSQLENQLYDAQSEKKIWQQSRNNELRNIRYQLEGVKQENKLLVEEFQFQREQMNNQLDQAAQQIAHLKQIISQSQLKINSSSSFNSQQAQKIKSLQQQLKNCKDQWHREKLQYIPTNKKLKQIENEILRYQKYAVQLQKKNKQLTQLAKRRLAEEPKSSCGELLRQVNTIILRNKSKILSRCGQRQREQVVADFKQIHEKIEGAIKSYHLLR